MCVWIYCTNFVRSISHYKKISATYYHNRTEVIPWTCQYVTETWVPSIYFRKKKYKYEISRKSVQWEPNCSLRANGRSDGHRETWRSSYSLIETLRTRLKARNCRAYKSTEMAAPSVHKINVRLALRIQKLRMKETVEFRVNIVTARHKHTHTHTHTYMYVYRHA